MNSYLSGVLAVMHCVLLLAAASAAPWRALLAVPVRLHLLFASVLALTLTWALTGNEWSVLGLASVTLLLGAPLALIVGTAAECVVAMLGDVPVRMLLTAAWVDVAIPVTVTVLLLRAATLWRPGHRRVYTLLAAGVGGMLSRLAQLLAFSAIATLQLPPETMLLMVLAEGLVNAAIIAILSACRPQWLQTLSEP
ncbi:MAG: hypothetical protein VX836_02530 [Pseudomonadota bacterium]|nr:hypothetical protein [Pseudomonadota bacterium]